MIECRFATVWTDHQSDGFIESALLAQFHPLEEALLAMGVVVWPMIAAEADDALTSAVHLASKLCAARRFRLRKRRAQGVCERENWPSSPCIHRR